MGVMTTNRAISCGPAVRCLIGFPRLPLTGMAGQWKRRAGCRSPGGEHSVRDPGPRSGAQLITSEVWQPHRKPATSHARDAVTTENKTAADLERVMHALKRERTEHRAAKRDLAALKADVLARIEALEQRQPPAPDLGQITGALAGIRSDLRAELATVRSELDELSGQVAMFIRQP
jgi:hypothetical protein